MAISYEITVGGFVFNVISGCGFEDGISIHPSTARLEDPAYIGALKTAVAAQPYLYARDYLDECVLQDRHGNHRRMPDDFLQRCVAYADLLESMNCPIEVTEEMLQCIWQIRAESERRRNRIEYGPTGNSLRQKILERDGHRCRYCGCDGYLHVDHVFPKSRGGKNTPDNLVAACPSCNQRKHARTPEEAGMELKLNG